MSATSGFFSLSLRVLRRDLLAKSARRRRCAARNARCSRTLPAATDFCVHTVLFLSLYLLRLANYANRHAKCGGKLSWTRRAATLQENIRGTLGGAPFPPQPPLREKRKIFIFLLCTHAVPSWDISGDTHLIKIWCGQKRLFSSKGHNT